MDAPGIKVLEQNYDYDLLTANNIIDKSVGEKVKTVTVNPANGENIFDSAEIGQRRLRPAAAEVQLWH